MSNLYNLLESENISNELKIEMVYRIAESLGEEISEEDIFELDKSFNLFGHNIQISKEPKKFSDNSYEKAVRYMSGSDKKPDHLDAAIDIHKKEAEAPKTEANTEPKTESTPKDTPTLTSIVKKMDADKQAEAQKKMAEENAARAAEAGRRQGRKEAVATLKKWNSRAAKRASQNTETTQKTTGSTKIGQAIKGAAQRAQDVVNDEVTTPTTPKRRGRTRKNG